MRAYKIVATVVAVPMLLFGMGGVAVADDISNSIGTSVDSVAEVMPLNVGGPNGSTTLYLVKRNDDGKSGCNLTGHTTLVVSLNSTNAAVATVSPSPVTFTNCDDTKALMVTPVAAGSATITASQISNDTGGTFNLAPVTFTVNVAAPAPSNTAPVVAVAGVAGGATYNKGSVPTATCNVIDAEDGNSSFAATLSAITGTYASDGIGSQTASCSYTDLGPAPKLTASSSATYSIGDPSAPVIGYTLTPNTAGGLNGWYIGNVSLAWSVNEPQSLNSLVKVGCADQTITTDQNETTYTCAATSAGGTSVPVSVTIKRDATPPVITATPSPVANLAGYNNSPVDVVYTCSDGMSGLAALCPAPDHATIDGTHIFDHAIFDNAGNSSSVSTTVNLDATKPTIIGSRTAANGEGWNNTDVIVTFTCTDTGTGASGIQSCVADGTPPASDHKTLSTEGVSQSVSGTATDNADNTNTATVGDIKIDKTPPVIAFAGRTPANDAGWNNTAVTVTWNCTDIGGSGVVDPTVSQTLNTEGADLSASGTCADLAGNTSAINTQSGINIDRTSPVVAYTSASPSANGVGWNNVDVTATFTATDNLSGFVGASLTTTGTATSSGEGEGLTVSSPSFTDLAGNTTAAGAATSVPFKVDKTPPTVSLTGGPSDGASYYFGSVPAAAPTCVASDALSGLDTCLVSGGGTTVGPHSYIATATDKAGNQATATHSYTVLAWTLKGFYQPVDMGDVWNTVKGGSTVPLKFQLSAGPTELTSTSAVKSFTQTTVACPGASAALEPIDFVTTGGTSLRYDTTGGQFIQNWATPKKPGTCYVTTMTAQDGSTISANFMLK
jgi:hypothetical protein